MTNLLNKLKLLFKKFLYLFPSPLPIGVDEFETWAKDILDTYQWPDNDSFRFALSTMIVNQGPVRAYRSKFYFNLVCHAAASKQIAGHFFQELKLKQQAAARAAQLAELEKQKSAEATAILSVVANDIQK